MHELVYAVSTSADGSMKQANSGAELMYENCEKFLNKVEATPEQAVLIYLTYGGDDFRRFRTVDESSRGEGFTRGAVTPADALFTTHDSVALFLPLADCVGTILYDPQTHCLGVVHLGRHNLEQSAGVAAVEYMQKEFGSLPANIVAYLSPAAGKDAYPLFRFDNKGLQEVATEQLVSAGVSNSNIDVDHRDTTTDETLFSHSEFLKGNRTTNGRHALVAMLKK